MISDTVIERLTLYLMRIQALRQAGCEWVSSKELADALGLTSSTVRQDLSHVDFSGISKRGYETAGLQAVLSRVIGADCAWRVVVVGAGNLGRALAMHEEFRRRGLWIRGIFDADPEKEGVAVGHLRVQPMSAIRSFVRKEEIDIGVIAVPEKSAQRVADTLADAGVHGILNLSVGHVQASEGVPVVDLMVVVSALKLCHALVSAGAGRGAEGAHEVEEGQAINGRD